MATYRALQADFTGGELDPMIEANINMNLRTIGVKESFNAYHLQTGPVIKRPPSKLICSFSKINIQGKIETQLKQGSVNLFFTADAVYAFFNDSFSKVLDYEKDHVNSMFAVYQSTVIETDGINWPIEYIISIDDNQISVSERELNDSVLINWKWSQKPKACAFAGGRLLFGFGSTVVASRTPEDDENRFYDFTLAEFTYTWQLTYEQQNLDGWKYKEINELSNDTGFTSNISNIKDLTKKQRIFSRKEIHVNRNVVDTPSDNDSFYDEYYFLYFDFDSWDSFATSDIEEIIEKLYETETPEWSKSWEEGTGTIEKQIAIDNAKQLTAEYTITDNYSDGELIITDVTLKQNYLRRDGKNEIVLSGSDIYPDIKAINPNYQSDSKNENKAPDVQVSHAIEINETDLFSSEILWIANLGRIIVGTSTAIFIATDDVLSPSTFDLKPTLYDGSAAKQPSILNSLLIYVSSDEKKLYGAVYNNDIQGLQSIELTTYARHLFLGGIKNVEIMDSPYRTICVLTNDNKLRIGSMMNTETGFFFAFSTWSINDDIFDYIFFDRGKQIKFLVILSNNNDSSSQQIHSITYREPYEYGLSGVELMIDHQQEVSVNDNIINVTDTFLPDGLLIDAILTKATGEKEVIRGLEIIDRTITLNDSYSEAIIGIPVKMRIQLFQQFIPNNSGTILESKHVVNEIAVQLFKSVGGEVWYNQKKVKSLLQLEWGNNIYGTDFIDPETNQPYSFSGVYSVANPTQQTTKDELILYSPEPYPFNIMGIALKYNITEVN